MSENGRGGNEGLIVPPSQSEDHYSSLFPVHLYLNRDNAKERFEKEIELNEDFHDKHLQTTQTAANP